MLNTYDQISRKHKWITLEQCEFKTFNSRDLKRMCCVCIPHLGPYQWLSYTHKLISLLEQVISRECQIREDKASLDKK